MVDAAGRRRSARWGRWGARRCRTRGRSRRPAGTAAGKERQGDGAQGDGGQGEGGGLAARMVRHGCRTLQPRAWFRWKSVREGTTGRSPRSWGRVIQTHETVDPSIRVSKGLDGARIVTAMSPGPSPDRPERAVVPARRRSACGAHRSTSDSTSLRPSRGRVGEGVRGPIAVLSRLQRGVRLLGWRAGLLRQ